MVKPKSDVIVRAYDLGGFGDIAGAMRVASHLQRTGAETEIRATSASALEKLRILKPDVSFDLKNSSSRFDGTVHVDVAGHYGDERNKSNRDIPHHYTEDMDNPQNRRKAVPSYLKSGLQEHKVGVPLVIDLNGHTPMFYRPFREWDLPKPEERDARKQILEAICSEKKGFFGSLIKYHPLARDLKRELEKFDKIGFAHLSPQVLNYPGEILLEHPYFQAVHSAHTNNDNQRLAIGLFMNGNLEAKVATAALQKYWNVIDSTGLVLRKNKDLPTLIFLGPQPQTTVAGLFLSSNIPNLVTGDLSLSDALYGLIAMNGPAFFYETPDWKVPTLIELTKMLERASHLLADDFYVGSNFLTNKWSNQEFIKANQPRINEAFGRVVKIFGDGRVYAEYTKVMRSAVRREILRRFGDVQVEGCREKDHYIKPGAPYLIQDATAKVVETLREDSSVLTEVEEVRKMLTNGVPVSINVKTGVLEPAPKPKSQTADVPFVSQNYISQFKEIKYTSLDISEQELSYINNKNKNKNIYLEDIINKYEIKKEFYSPSSSKYNLNDEISIIY